MSDPAPSRGGAGGYAAFVQLTREIRTAHESGANLAAMAMVYVGIDTMALLACPLGKTEQSKEDFIQWVDTYLRVQPPSDYQYEGADVYAARCALLHSYGGVAKDHRGASPPRMFGYTSNGPHVKDEAVRFVNISIAILIDDFYRALVAFGEAMLTDPELKRRVDSRVRNLLLSRNIAHRADD